MVRPGGSICLVDTDFDATAIYSSHRKLTRKLTSTVAAAVPNPNSARELPALARLAGLDNVQVELSAVSTPYRFMMHAMGGVLREAVARGEISEAEFDEWRNEQAHLQENGAQFRLKSWLTRIRYCVQFRTTAKAFRTSHLAAEVISSTLSPANSMAI